MKRASRRNRQWNGAPTVAEFCSAMESIAPTGLAQSWDNVGLLVGDKTAPSRRVMLAIDLTRAVLEEARRFHADVLLAYHPPIFKPISSLCTPGAGMDALVFECIRHGIAVFSPHTALDAADGGTNDVLASLCGATQTEPLVYVETPGRSECKLVVFVPEDHVERVSAAMFAAGAGRIGNYECCSFRSTGVGTFFGSESTMPAVGKKGRLETVDEVRLESIVSSASLPDVIASLRSTHPYDEPAFDVYPLKPLPVRGIGRFGRMDRPVTMRTLAQRLQRATRVANVQAVGPGRQQIDRVVVVAGAAGSLPFRVSLTSRDAVITGEIRHHDALAFQRIGCCAIALGHWASERPVLGTVATQLREHLRGITIRLSRRDADPFSAVTRRTP